MALFSILLLCILTIISLVRTVESLPLINGQKNVPDIILETGDTLILSCSDDLYGKEWILPNNTGYEGYSNPKVNNRTSEEDIGDELKLTIENVAFTDTGIYKCKKIKAITIGGPANGDISESNKVHVFVKGIDSNHLFLHYKNNEIKSLSIRPDQPSEIPCLVTDPAATVELWIKGQKQDVPYNPLKGFVTIGDELRGLAESSSTEVECRARNSKGYIDLMKFRLTLLASSHFELTIDATRAQNQYVSGTLIMECIITDVDNPEEVNFHWKIPSDDEINWDSVVARVYARKETKGKTVKSRLTIFPVKMEDQGQYFCSCLYLNKENMTNVTITISETKGQVNVDTSRYYDYGSLEFEATMHIYPPGDENWNNSWLHTYIDPVTGLVEKRIGDDNSKEMTYVNLYTNQGIVIIEATVLGSRKRLTNGRQTATTTAVLHQNALSRANSSGSFELRVTAGGEQCRKNISTKGCFHGTVTSFNLSTNATHVISRISIVKLDDLNSEVNPRFLEVNKQYLIVCRGADSPTLPDVFLERCADRKCKEVSAAETQDGTFERAKIFSFTPTQPKSEFRCSAARSDHLLDPASPASATITLVATDIENSENEKGVAVTIDHVPGGQDGIEGEIYENDKLSIVCSTQKFDYSSSSWGFELYNGSSIQDPAPLKTRKDKSSMFSNKVIMDIPNLSKKHSGVYTCTAMLHGKRVEKKFKLKVLPLIKPKFVNGENSEYTVEYKRKDYEINCTIAQGSPKPKLNWFKDGNPLEEGEFYDDNQRLVITEMDAGDAGTYECRLKNRAGVASQFTTLVMSGAPFLTAKGTIILSVVVALGLLIVLVLCGLLYWQRRKERKKEALLQELYDRFMSTANDGQVSTPMLKLDPEKPVNQQAENLPYDRRYEIKKELVAVSEKLLGEGQFGKVFKGSFTSPVTKKELPVAVKVPQRGMSLQDQKMLLDELKIMIHIGRHPNVLSLVGAITKFMVKGELYVIVEFCGWGELREYIKQRRAGFLNEIVQDVQENRASEGSELTWANYEERVQAVQSSSSSDSETTVYNSEVVLNWTKQLQENRTPNILTTSDILSYCYQAAKGMDYLAGRNVLHRDLAARNLLLTENQVVKVADFGLAKQEQTYQMQTSQYLPLPVRWMALESIEDQKFTDKSDIWSFGVLVWELFSLGEFPYADIDKNLLGYLKSGQRLEQPHFAPVEIYQLMRQTWLHNPLERPTFADCCKILGTELERCSKPLFDSINRTLAEEEELKLHNYVNWREIAESEPVTPTGETPNSYENVKLLNGYKLAPIIDSRAKLNDSYMIPMNQVHTNDYQNIAVC